METKDENNYNNLERDLDNITYSARIFDVYNRSGRVHPFQQEKYRPIIKYIIEYHNSIGKNLDNIKLLDIGVGYGAFLKLCGENGFKKLYGMDPFPNSIAIARKYTSANLRVGKIEDLPWPFKENYFNVVTCLDVVEHLQYPEIFFKNVKRYIIKDGIVVVRTPNGGLPYLMRKLPFIGIKDTNPTHINVHTPKYWKELADKNGFEIIKDWKGEHLTHIKGMNIIDRLSRKIKIDHRKIPLLNKFEQAYIMVIKLRKA